MYDKSSQEQLKEKLGYEIWLLDYLSNTEELFGGETYIPIVTLTNKQTTLHRKVGFSDASGTQTAQKIINSMTPLIFTACYKILDMIFEWILEENYLNDPIKNKKHPSTWRFSEKIEQIPSLNLIYPPEIEVELHLRDYLFALYKNLLDIRNEIIHRKNFSVSGDGKLSVNKVNLFDLTTNELNALAKSLVTIARILSGELKYGLLQEKSLKYHLDLIQKVHQLDKFDQLKPRLISVKLEVRRENGIFPADLKFLREKFALTYPTEDVLFDLEIVGLVDDQPISLWKVPLDSVPNIDILVLPSDDFDKFKKPLS